MTARDGHHDRDDESESDAVRERRAQRAGDIRDGAARADEYEERRSDEFRRRSPERPVVHV